LWYVTEEVILAEERTTEEEKMHIIEGECKEKHVLSVQFCDCDFEHK
jgi:hypothetical protein